MEQGGHISFWDILAGNLKFTSVPRPIFAMGNRAQYPQESSRPRLSALTFSSVVAQEVTMLSC